LSGRSVVKAQHDAIFCAVRGRDALATVGRMPPLCLRRHPEKLKTGNRELLYGLAATRFRVHGFWVVV
jgi:hypothetical protein